MSKTRDFANIASGLTSTAEELNYLNVTTPGESETSKALTTNASGNTVINGGLEVTGTFVADTGGGSIPKSGASKTSSYTLTADDSGQGVYLSSGSDVTIPTGIFATGDYVYLYNESDQWINVDASAVTAYKNGLPGTVTNFSLSPNSLIRTYYPSGTETIVERDVDDAIVANATILTVAGGGGGARGDNGSGAGGGAGGMLEGEAPLFAGETYTITVGAGGPRSNSANDAGGVGDNTVFERPVLSENSPANITSFGGGGSLTPSDSSFYYGRNALAGGSGGGGSTGRFGAGSGGAGVAGQGFAGGRGYTSGTQGYYLRWSGGGGGAGEVGEDYYASGGDGLETSIDGTPTYYAGGGAGVYQNLNGQYGTFYGTPGLGGGGTGNGSGGGVNTGGGGGGGSTPYAGGSGICIIRIPTSAYTGTTTGSPTVTTDGDYTILKYTASGTYTA